MNMPTPTPAEEVLAATRRLLDAVAAADWKTYKELVADDITCFEPEAQGQLVAGLPFHKFYFDLAGETSKGTSHVKNSHIKTPKAYTSVAVDLDSPLNISGAQYARVVACAALPPEETAEAVVSTWTAPPKSQNCGDMVRWNTGLSNAVKSIRYL